MSKDETVTAVNINVTPVMKDDDTVICQISPAPGSESFVRGGVIKLNKGADYTLNFTLQDGDLPGLNFDAAGEEAFWCAPKSCPSSKKQNSHNQMGPPSVTNGRSLSVTSTPNGSRNAIHYSLGFDNGCRYDPIIIHD